MAKFFVCLLLATILATLASGGIIKEEEIDLHFNLFKELYSRVYTSAKEESYRKKIFVENYLFIKESNSHHQAGRAHFELEMNNFTDYTDEEFRSIFLSETIRGDQPRLPNAKVHKATGSEGSDYLPDGSNWAEGVITPVMNQGKCASGWAFAAVSAIEGAHELKRMRFNDLVKLSVQELVDCISDEGCSKGHAAEYAFEYVIKNRGIDSALSYPYSGVNGKCHYSSLSGKIGANISSFVYVDRNEAALKSAVNSIGPIAALIDASKRSFRFYKSGVYDEPECSSVELNHGVTVTGYDYESELFGSWKVKNSWGSDWGENGYIRMVRNKANQCGIASMASFPLV